MLPLEEIDTSCSLKEFVRISSCREFVQQKCFDSCAIAAILMMIGRGYEYWDKIKFAVESSNFQYIQDSGCDYTWTNQPPEKWHTIDKKGCLDIINTLKKIGYAKSNIKQWKKNGNVGDEIVFPCFAITKLDKDKHLLLLRFNEGIIEICDPLPKEYANPKVNHKHFSNHVIELIGIKYDSDAQVCMNSTKFLEYVSDLNKLKYIVEEKRPSFLNGTSH